MLISLVVRLLCYLIKYNGKAIRHIFVKKLSMYEHRRIELFQLTLRNFLKPIHYLVTTFRVLLIMDGSISLQCNEQ